MKHQRRLWIVVERICRGSEDTLAYGRGRWMDRFLDGMIGFQRAATFASRFGGAEVLCRSSHHHRQRRRSSWKKKEFCDGRRGWTREGRGSATRWSAVSKHGRSSPKWVPAASRKSLCTMGGRRLEALRSGIFSWRGMGM